MVTNKKFALATGTLTLPTDVTSAEDVDIPDDHEDSPKYVIIVIRSYYGSFCVVVH